MRPSTDVGPMVATVRTLNSGIGIVARAMGANMASPLRVVVPTMHTSQGRARASDGG